MKIKFIAPSLHFTTLHSLPLTHHTFPTLYTLTNLPFTHILHNTYITHTHVKFWPPVFFRNEIVNKNDANVQKFK